MLFLSARNVVRMTWEKMKEMRRKWIGITPSLIVKSPLALFFWIIILVLYGMLFLVTPSSTAHSSALSFTKERRLRIFCLVLTHPTNHRRQAKAVKETWGRRCDKLVFISSLDDPQLPSINAGVPEGREHLWAKTRSAFKYAFQFTDSFDWFYKADDDTYAIMENMRHLLVDYSPEEHLWFGSRFRRFVTHGYMSGGAGYVLSRAAVRRLVKEGFQKQRCKRNESFAEDVEMGRCMQTLKVRAADSRDHVKRTRFFPFLPADHLAPTLQRRTKTAWYWKTLFYPEKEGSECCSQRAITFHYVTPEKMREMEYLVYTLKSS